MSLREDILAADDLPLTEVEVPEWRATVYVRCMTGAERDQYEGDIIAKSSLPHKERMKHLRSSLVVLCTVDEDGERIFSDDDKEAVGKKSAEALNRIVLVAQEVNALGDDSTIEEMAGNSEPSTDADSISD